MPRVSTLDKEAVAKYCTEPRSIHDLCWKCGICGSQAHRVMGALHKAGVISSRLIKGSGSQHLKFLLSSLESEYAWGGDAPFVNPLMAHDPFGLTNRLALELKQQGVSVEKFAKQYTRQIRVLDVDPRKVAKAKRKVWGKNT